jgi:secreted trypsin-like serine protease
MTQFQGDNGGPFNLNNGSEPAIVAGLSSWKPQSENPYSQCRTDVPTMYTRTSAYLDWIKTNTP